MTNSQPRAPRPSAIRRRPQTVQSVDEFIQAGTGGDAAIAEVSQPPETPVQVTPEPVAASVLERHAPPAPPKGEGKAYFALFVGVCALAVGLFNLYHSPWGPIVREALQGSIPSVAPPVTSLETVPSRVEAFFPPSVPVQVVESVSQPSIGSQRVQWLALTDLQFARHDLLLGLNESAEDSLILAKVHLGLLGESFAAEASTLDRLIVNLKGAQVLSLGQLDSDIETLKGDWLRMTFGSSTKPRQGLLDWLTPWRRSVRQEGRTELETTDAGRYLVARLDRLKWLALWGDERGFRQASATIETFLGPQFLGSSDAKLWSTWIRGLQRIPLRHDVTELNTLIVRLSRLELPP